MELMRLEFRKLKRTSMFTIVIALSILPVVLILAQYLASGNDQKEMYKTIASNNVIITMCIYTASIILANYIFTREYQDRTHIYMFITPQSRLKILCAKYSALLVVLLAIGAISHALTLLLDFAFDGVNVDIVIRLIKAWLAGAILFFLLMPFISAIALWRKNFISAMLISLILMIFTTPFMFTNNFYAFPHLIPMAVANNLLRIDNKLDINYGLAFGIIIVVFISFSIVSVKLFERKE